MKLPLWLTGAADFLPEQEFERPLVRMDYSSGSYNNPWLFNSGAMSESGVAVTVDAAMRIAVAWRCVHVICGVMAGLPLDLMKRIDERTRKPAADNGFRNVLTVKPNRWQTPGEFKRMLQAHLLLRGSGFAYKSRVGREIRELVPLDCDRMKVTQNDDLSIGYVYTTRTGRQVAFTQEDIFHLRGLSLDGVNALSVVAYAKNAMGLSLQTEKAGARLFKNGTLTPIVLEHPGQLSDAARDNLKESIDKDYAGADKSGRPWLLEEGMKLSKIDFTADDLQFLATRGFQRTDVGMFFGVPAFIYGDTEKSTSWGTGIEQQNIGFLQYTIGPWITIWEEALKRDCLADGDPTLYAHFDTKGFLRMDSAARREWIKMALGHGGGQPMETLNEVRAAEELPPINEPWADKIQQAPIQAASAVPPAKTTGNP